MRPSGFVIGVDFGTDSVRALIVDSRDGTEAGSAVALYPRWRDGLFCDPAKNQFRQHPLDYLDSLQQALHQALAVAGPAVASRVLGLSVDTTGSTPVVVDRQGTPLALLPGWESNPNAMFVLWKDHTAVAEAEAINAHNRRWQTDYLRYVGGIYSSEWFWAKLLHLLREDPSLRPHAYSFVEHCDWIPFVLTGGNDVLQMKRGVCAAGHKALWAEDFGGLPPDEYFKSLDPLLAGWTSRLFHRTHTSDQPAGRIDPEWARKLGLPQQVTIGVGAFDAHMGAVGGQIEPYHLSKVMGTSTCDMLVAPLSEMQGKLVRGICGQVPGSILPDRMGMEAGQSAFGDAYAWFRQLLSWPLLQPESRLEAATVQDTLSNLIARLSGAAEALPLEEGAEIAVDWLNGRRTPDANQRLQGVLGGLHLGTDAPRLFRAIAESTCFGAKAIVDRFLDEGIPVKGLIGLGGVAHKSPYVMQMLADVIDMPLRIHRSPQTCALGAAMFAATAAGCYSRVEEAMAAMGPGFSHTYQPRTSAAAFYRPRYERYRRWGAFLQTDATSSNKTAS